MDSVAKKLMDALEILKSIEDSGYWPFASPAPCSTEVKIKRAIENAIMNINTAMYYHGEEFGKTGRDCLSAPSLTIVERK